MKSVFKTPLILIFCFFSQTIFSQYFELLRGKSMSLSNHVEYTNKGGLYSVSRFGVDYVSSIENGSQSPMSKEFKKIKFEKVKWDNGDSFMEIIDTKAQGENLVFLGAVRELKTNDVVIVKYTFDPQLNMTEEELVRVQSVEKSYLKLRELKNKNNACSSLIVYAKSVADKKSTTATLKMRVVSFDSELNNNGNVEFEKEVDRYYNVEMVMNSAILLENGNIVLNEQKKLFLFQRDISALIPLALEIEKTIYSYKLFAGPKNGLILIGGFIEGKTVGMATVEINSSGTIEDQKYMPFTNRFTKEFYELANELNPKSGNKNLKYDDFSHVRPALIDAKIEEDGMVRAVFMGIVKDKDSMSFRNNFIIVGEKDQKPLYEHVIPYIYKEGAYVSVGSTAICVFFDDNSTTICYQDYQQNYDDKLNFLPTTEKIPFINKPLYASARFYYDSDKHLHKMLDVKTKAGITYKKNASYMAITDIVLPDNSILIGCDEWGVATLKESYLGRLVIP